MKIGNGLRERSLYIHQRCLKTAESGSGRAARLGGDRLERPGPGSHIMENLNKVIERFGTAGVVSEIKPLGNGLINDTYIVRTSSEDTPDYVLQRINHHIFTDVDALQQNIGAVTSHIRRKLEAAGEDDIDRKVLTFVTLKDSPKTYFFDGENYWRMMVFIPRARTFEAVTAESSRAAGAAFGRSSGCTSFTLPTASAATASRNCCRRNSML